MGKHVIVGVGAVGRGVARELAARRPRGGGGLAIGAGPGRRRRAGRGARRDRCRRAHGRRARRRRPLQLRQPRGLHALGAGVAAARGVAAAVRDRLRCGLRDHGQPLRLRRRSAGPITPELPLATPSANGRIRVRMWEEALAAHRAGRVRVTEVRASDFIGPESGANAHLGDRVIPRILAGKKVRAFAAADQPHSWTYVPDVARTIAALGTDDRSWGRAWHVPTNPALHPARGVRVDRGRRRGPDAAGRHDLGRARSAPSASRCR